MLILDLPWACPNGVVIDANVLQNSLKRLHQVDPQFGKTNVALIEICATIKIWLQRKGPSWPLKWRNSSLTIILNCLIKSALKGIKIWAPKILKLKFIFLRSAPSYCHFVLTPLDVPYNSMKAHLICPQKTLSTHIFYDFLRPGAYVSMWSRRLKFRKLWALKFCSFLLGSLLGN